MAGLQKPEAQGRYGILRVGERRSRDRPWRASHAKAAGFTQCARPKLGSLKWPLTPVPLCSLWIETKSPLCGSLFRSQLFLLPVTVRVYIASTQRALSKLLFLPDTVLGWIQAVPTVIVKR